MKKELKDTVLCLFLTLFGLALGYGLIKLEQYDVLLFKIIAGTIFIPTAIAMNFTLVNIIMKIFR